MFRRFLTRLLAVTAACALGGEALAGMSVDRSIIYFPPDGSERVDVTVSNDGAEPMFVETRIDEVLDPGTPRETRVGLSGTVEPAMLVSPNMMVIPSGQKKLLRLVNLVGNRDRERVFRITVKPVPAPAKAKQSGIRVFVAYELLVFVLPERPVADLQSRRVGGRLIFENHGNTNVLLHTGRQCPAGAEADDERCAQLPGSRLYPGGFWALETPFETPVRFVVAQSGRNALRTF